MAIVLKSLSILLGLFFVFVGFLKMSSYISKDLHKDLVRWCLVANKNVIAGRCASLAAGTILFEIIFVCLV